jgi:hypothetical protein
MIPRLQDLYMYKGWDAHKVFHMLVKFRVLTVMSMKMAVFWDVMTCNVADTE